MTDRDLRQLRLMAQRLSAFKVGRLHLRTLAGDLEALLAAIENFDDAQRAPYEERWSTLELILAHHPEHPYSGPLAADEQREVEAAVDQLETLVNDDLARHAGDEANSIEPIG
jgi:hypothetical protein